MIPNAFLLATTIATLAGRGWWRCIHAAEWVQELVPDRPKGSTSAWMPTWDADAGRFNYPASPSPFVGPAAPPGPRTRRSPTRGRAG